MEKYKLGHSDLEVSKFGLGGMSLSSADVAKSAKLIQQAYEIGINYFDTADLYDRGANEEIIGRALAGLRSKVVLATKVGNAWQDGQDGWTWNPSRQHILRSIEGSLRRLNTDYIDLYQLHGGMISDNFEEIIETFERLQEEGKIRYYGLSSIRPNVFLKYIHQAKPVSNMMQYSLLDTRPEEYLEEFTTSRTSVLARGGFAQGLLLDKAIRKPYLQHDVEETVRISHKVANAAAAFGVSKETIALKYVTASPVVASSIIGIRTLDHLTALRKSIDEWYKVSANEVYDYFAQIPKIQYQEHRD